MCSSSSLWSSLFLKEPIILAKVLPVGQAFRWTLDGTSGVWYGELFGTKCFLEQASDKHIRVQTCPPPSDTSQLVDKMKHYLRTDLNFEETMATARKNDPAFGKVSSMNGVTLLRQGAWETVLAFICSANNNIPRISSMMLNLAQRFGTKLSDCRTHEHLHSKVPIHALPSPVQLNSVVGLEQQLRDLKFGYRAKYIAQTANMIAKQPSLLHKPSDSNYTEVFQNLQALPGVGKKVADCICLMGFDFTEAVPLDTHMLKLFTPSSMYTKYLHCDSANKTALYEKQSQAFRSVWGQKHAGIVQSLVFSQVITTKAKPARKRKSNGKLIS